MACLFPDAAMAPPTALPTTGPATTPAAEPAASPLIDRTTASYTFSIVVSEACMADCNLPVETYLASAAEMLSAILYRLSK